MAMTSKPRPAARSPMTAVWQEAPAGAPPRVPLPGGRDVDLWGNALRYCVTALDHPAPGIGWWVVHCNRCGLVIEVPARGGAADPRTVGVACKALLP